MNLYVEDNLKKQHTRCLALFWFSVLAVAAGGMAHALALVVITTSRKSAKEGKRVRDASGAPDVCDYCGIRVPLPGDPFLLWVPSVPFPVAHKNILIQGVCVCCTCVCVFVRNESRTNRRLYSVQSHISDRGVDLEVFLMRERQNPREQNCHRAGNSSSAQGKLEI